MGILRELRQHWKLAASTGLIIALPVAYLAVAQTTGRPAAGPGAALIGFSRVSRPARRSAWPGWASPAPSRWPS